MSIAEQARPGAASVAGAATRSVDTVVREAVPDDLEGIVRLIDSRREPSAPSIRESFARLFTIRWEDAGGGGYVLENDHEIVGFLGILTHTRCIQGERRVIHNLTSWYVDRQYRSRSLSLVRAALRRKDITYTVLTAIPPTLKVWKHFGFQILDDQRRIIYPALRLRRRRPRVSIFTGDVSRRLPAELSRIYHDHQHLPCCEHVVLESNGQQCYLVLVRRPRRFFASAKIIYVSDTALFRQCLPAISGELCYRLRVASLRVDERLLRGVKVPFSRCRPLHPPYLFRSNCLEPEDVDALYSELPVMEL